MNSVVKSIIWTVLGVLTVSLCITLWLGDIAYSGPVLFGSPWGIMTLIDLYAGFLLFSLFIFFQETDKKRALLWTLGLMLLGNLLACIYLITKFKHLNFHILSKDTLAEPAKKH